MIAVHLIDAARSFPRLIEPGSDRTQLQLQTRSHECRGFEAAPQPLETCGQRCIECPAGSGLLHETERIDIILIRQIFDSDTGCVIIVDFIFCEDIDQRIGFPFNEPDKL